MARAGRVVAGDARAARGAHPAGCDDGRARRDRRGVHPLARRRADVQGLQGLSGRHLPLAERHGRARDPGRRRSSPTGDILSVDVGVTLDGFVADSAWTFAVGSIAPEAQRLLDICRAALEAGIEQARVGNAIGDISRAVQTVTEAAGFSVIRSLVGHGVGRSMHEDPQVPNFVSSHRGPELKEGMTIAIEPMITAGAPDVYIHDDDWSISTVDGVARRPLRAHGRGHRARARAS